MTVNSFYYQKPNSTTLLPNLNIKKARRVGKSYLSNSSKGGFVSSVWLFLIGILVIIGTIFICSQSMNGDLDYRITEAKGRLKALEIENAELKTNLVKNISPEHITSWAKENNFVKNNNFSHYSIDQVKTLSLNTNN